MTAFACGTAGADVSVTGDAGTRTISTNINAGRGTNCLAAHVKAIIVVNGAVTGDDLTNLKAYIASTYGVSYS
jgi:hypothetical protein